MRSMTGYGRGEYTGEKYKFTVEMKAVNHRYSEINIKLSRIYMMLEDRIRKLIQANVARGKIEVYVNIEKNEDAASSVTVDKALAKAYYDALTEVKDMFDMTDSISLGQIVRFPNVLNVEEMEEDVDSMWSGLENAIKIALSQFNQARLLEGERLKNDFNEKISSLNELIEAIEKQSPLVEKNYQERLFNRMTKLLGGEFDENRIMLEVGIFAEKTSIDEEIVRFKSHLEQAKMFLEADKPVGRQFDFLIQEMNREMNTIGSKGNDSVIAKQVIQGKNEIEKIREQIQNIE